MTTVEGGSLRPEAEVWHIVAFSGVRLELPGQNPEVLLHEADAPWRELRIPVGLAEGNAIAYAWRGVTTPRPFTHDLMAELLDRHHVEVVALRLTARRNTTFFAELESRGPGGTVTAPCRPSDGIALVLRQQVPVPILAAEWVFTSPDDDVDRDRS